MTPAGQKWRGLLASAVAVAALSACTDDPAATKQNGQQTEQTEAINVDTPDLRALKKSAAIEPCPDHTAGQATNDLPDVELPCLGGGRAVALAGIKGPALVNFWAQYCGPCREESPIFQQAHERLGDELTIIGVDWQDPYPGKALAFADELGLTYPQLADPDGVTRTSIPNALPVTLFVDADGTVSIADSVIDSESELAGMLSEHLGIDDAWVDAS